ncbi:MAG: ABC transporter ATP-binding protein [Anaerolineales bacterium]|nr:ABC transporter ATP-binding protein [Anaerolineales bacterium]
MALDRLHYRYPGAADDALRDVSFEFPAGQRIALLGRNGSGKSTLVLHCNGLLRPRRGTVRLDGQPVAYDRRSLLRLRRHVGVVFQNPDEQLFSASVAEDISLGPLNLGLSQAEVRDRVQIAAALCDIEPLLERPTHALSGGEKTRVALAGILAMDPDILIADEVTNSLDPWMRQQVLVIFERLVAQAKTVMLATHDLELARRWADRVLVMEAGRLVANGRPAQVFADPLVRSLLALDDRNAGSTHPKES